MARIVSSQVIAYIDRIIPGATSGGLGPGQAGELAGLLNLIERIPEELLLMVCLGKEYFEEVAQLIRPKAWCRSEASK